MPDGPFVDRTITRVEDWDRLWEGSPPLAIVDPMVFRTADVYLRGRAGMPLPGLGIESDRVREVLEQNVGSLVGFFDALIMTDHLPIIDYGATFEDIQAHELVQSATSAIRSFFRCMSRVTLTGLQRTHQRTP